ncbi:MAG: chemotaxis protein CheW [Acidobacteriota bacterium]
MAPQFCTFHVGDLFLGIEVERIQEVLRDAVITPVPLAPPEVRGLINLRGQIVTAIDLRRRFGLEDPSTDATPATLVLRFDDELVSLVADRAGDPPDTLKGERRRLIRGAFKLEDRLLLALDVANALAIGKKGGASPAPGGGEDV